MVIMCRQIHIPKSIGYTVNCVHKYLNKYYICVNYNKIKKWICDHHERHIFLFHPFKLYTTLIFLIFIFGPQLNHIRPNLANKTLNIWKEI